MPDHLGAGILNNRGDRMDLLANLGIDSYSFHIAFAMHGFDRILKLRKAMKLPQFFELAAQWQIRILQIDPVHIPGLEGRALAGFKDLLQSFNFEIILGSYISLVHRDYLASVAAKRYQKYFDACRSVNSHILCGVCGADRFHKGSPLREQLDLVGENLKSIAPKALDAGVTIAFENHGSLTASELVSLVTRVNSPAVKINLDNGNSLLAFEDPVEAFRIMAPHTVVLHFKDYKRRQTGYGMIVEGCELGAGVIDLPAQLKIYKDVCPQAKLCVEMSLARGKEEPAVKSSLDYLRKVLPTID